jgi:hypothetical protein
MSAANFLHERARRHSGQAMVLFLGFAAAMVAMLLVAFNSGQVTNAKMRAMNAADAAAYSGALWQARNLNFQAYMNRAIVANEVTIAQAVTVRSWVAYVDRFVGNVNTIAQFIPYVNAAVRAIDRVIDAVDDTVQRTLPLAESAIRALGNLEHGAQVAFDAAAPLAAQSLASNVAIANGAEVSTGGNTLILRNLNTWRGFTDTYSPGARRQNNNDRRVRLREVILNSRDGFVQERDWRMGLPFVFGLRKQGGTDLLDYDTWKGLDSLQVGTVWNPVKRRWNVRAPLAWGGAQAHAPQEFTGVGRHGDINEWSDLDGRLARNMSNDNTHSKRLPARLPGYRDLSRARLQSRTDPRLPFSVEVVIARNRVPTSDDMQARVATQRGAVLQVGPQYQGQDGGVFALAEACVAFERPFGQERRDGLAERPSLFNPYWRAYMATPSRAARTIVDGAKGLVPVAALLGGAGSCGQ